MFLVLLQILGLFLYLLTSWFSSTLEAPEEEKMQILRKRLNWVVGPLIECLVGKKNRENANQPGRIFFFSVLIFK